MLRSSQRGFTMGEVLLVTSLLTFASTGVMTLISKKTGRSNGEQHYKQMVMDGRGTVEQIVAELRLAGLPRTADNTSLTFANSNQIAANTFLVASGDQIVFEADIDHNGSIERVEYRLRGESLERSAVTKYADGSVPQAKFETIAERVDNGGLPVFTYDGDFTGEQPVSPDPQQVRVLLLLRSPVRDRKAGRARTVGFEAVAQRNLTPSTVAPAHIEASTPEPNTEPGGEPTRLTPADVAETNPSDSPASEPTAENRSSEPVQTDAQNSQDSPRFPNHQLLDLPVIYPADAAQPESSANTVAAASAGQQLRAGLVIATTSTNPDLL